MEQHTNEGRMCGNIDLRNKETEISNPNPGLVLSGSDDSGASTLSNSTKQEPNNVPPLLAKCDIDESDHNHEIVMTTPRTEGRDDILLNEGQNTPTEGVNSKERLEKFYNRIKRSHPEATENQGYGEIVEVARTLVELADDPEFKDKTFDDLEDDQKAILTYEVLIGMHELWDSDGGNLYRPANILQRTWKKRNDKNERKMSDEFKRVWSFVLQGRDIVQGTGYTTLVQNKGQSFFDEHAVWNKQGSIDIFNLHGKKPIYYIQHDNSYVCGIIAAVLSMLYSAKGFDHNKARQNVSRFIRNEIDAEMIANLVLTERKGAHLKDVFSGLVKCFGVPGSDSMKDLQMHGKSEETNYQLLKWILESGRAIAFTIEVFPDLLDRAKKRYLGEISDFYPDENEEPRPDKANRTFHALVIVGIRPRVGTIGPVLLVQDSCNKTRPFYEISLSLLMSMNIEELDFFTVCHNWKFRENGDYLMTPASRARFVGSPFQIKSSGEVPVVPQNQEPLRDMSDYFTHVEDPDNPDPIYCI